MTFIALVICFYLNFSTSQIYPLKDQTTRVTSSGTDYDEEWSCTEPYVREGLADRLEYCDLRAYSSISGTHTSRLRAAFWRLPSPHFAFMIVALSVKLLHQIYMQN